MLDSTTGHIFRQSKLAEHAENDYNSHKNTVRSLTRTDDSSPESISSDDSGGPPSKMSKINRRENDRAHYDIDTNSLAADKRGPLTASLSADGEDEHPQPSEDNESEEALISPTTNKIAPKAPIPRFDDRRSSAAGHVPSHGPTGGSVVSYTPSGEQENKSIAGAVLDRDPSRNGAQLTPPEHASTTERSATSDSHRSAELSGPMEPVGLNSMARTRSLDGTYRSTSDQHLGGLPKIMDFVDDAAQHSRVYNGASVGDQNPVPGNVTSHIDHNDSLQHLPSLSEDYRFAKALEADPAVSERYVSHHQNMRFSDPSIHGHYNPVSSNGTTTVGPLSGLPISETDGGHHQYTPVSIQHRTQVHQPTLDPQVSSHGHAQPHPAYNTYTYQPDGKPQQQHFPSMELPPVAIPQDRTYGTRSSRGTLNESYGAPSALSHAGNVSRTQNGHVASGQVPVTYGYAPDAYSTHHNSSGQPYVYSSGRNDVSSPLPSVPAQMSGFQTQLAGPPANPSHHSPPPGHVATGHPSTAPLRDHSHTGSMPTLVMPPTGIHNGNSTAPTNGTAIPPVVPGYDGSSLYSYGAPAAGMSTVANGMANVANGVNSVNGVNGIQGIHSAVPTNGLHTGVQSYAPGLDAKPQVMAYPVMVDIASDLRQPGHSSHPAGAYDTQGRPNYSSTLPKMPDMTQDHSHDYSYQHSSLPLPNGQHLHSSHPAGTHINGHPLAQMSHTRQLSNGNPGRQRETKFHRCTYPGCQWSFVRSSDHKRHIRSHEKPSLRCPYWQIEPSCNKKAGMFYRLDVLKRHLRLVHLIRPNDGSQEGGRCRVCMSVFTSTRAFIDHCDQCAKDHQQVPEDNAEKKPDQS